MRNFVVLTGAGISKESGIDTFRDLNGLWAQHDVMEVGTIEGWRKNPKKIIEFMNGRRAQLEKASPNAAHCTLAEMENDLEVHIITQNVDNLHERAGSTRVLHLHGELTKARSSVDADLIVDIGYRQLRWGEKAPDGSQLRPHVVLFGENVPAIDRAVTLVKRADIFAIIGTSLNVFPASKLIHHLPADVPVYLIDPNDVETWSEREIVFIKENASTGVKKLQKIINQSI